MKAIALVTIIAFTTLLSSCSNIGISTNANGKGRGECNGAKTNNWYAWEDLQPGSDHSLHVTGQVGVRSGGWKVALAKRNPQGINPRILLLDLHVTPPRGLVIQPVLTLDARYSEKNAAKKYDRVEVYCGSKKIAYTKVKQARRKGLSPIRLNWDATQRVPTVVWKRIRGGL